MRNKLIKFTEATVGKKELYAIKKTFESSYLGLGKKVKEFEKKFKNFIRTKHAIALSSCTAALDLSIKVNNFKKGKKILVPALTFTATAAVVLHNNLEPIFVDINKSNLNMSFEDLKKKYTKDCVGVMLVHFGGHPCEMEKIVPWCRKKNLIIIEDCAHVCGGEYLGKKLGSWGDYGCFSFEEKKIMTTGDGGMLCTNKTNKVNIIRSLSYHGQNKDPWERNLKKKKKTWDYKVVNLGFKYNMNNLQASIGIEQLAKLRQMNKKRISILKNYILELKKQKNLTLAIDYKLKNSCYWLLILCVPNRDKLLEFLKRKKINASVQLRPLPLHPLYKKFNKHNLYNAMKKWRNFISLPLHTRLTKSDIIYVTKCINFFYKKNFNG